MADDGTTPDPVEPKPRAWVPPASQDELDEIIRRAVGKYHSKYADYDDLKAKAEKLDELETANQSELEKLLARAEAAEKAASEATERARSSSRRSAVIAAASTAGAVDPDAVFALLPGDAVTIGDDGQVTGAEDAVKALLESKPYLVGQAATPPKPTGTADGGARGSGSGPRQLSRADLSSMTPEQIVQADTDGLLDDIKSGVA